MIKSLIVVMALASTAAAKDSMEIAAAKKLLDAQVAAIGSGDAPGFAKTFSDDAYVVFPSTAEASDRAGLDAAAKTWLGGLGKTKVVAQAPLFGTIENSTSAWIAVELVASGATTARWRVTELVIPPQGDDHPTGDGYRVIAAHISEPVDDKVALDLVDKGKLPALPAMKNAIGGSDGSYDNPSSFGKYTAIGSDPAIAVIGSAPTEYVTGKAVAAKFKEFTKLSQKTISYARQFDAVSMGAAKSVVGHVEVTYKIKGKDVVVPYRVMIVTGGPLPTGHGDTHVDVLHYSVATH